MDDTVLEIQNEHGSDNARQDIIKNTYNYYKAILVDIESKYNDLAVTALEPNNPKEWFIDRSKNSEEFQKGVCVISYRDFQKSSEQDDVETQIMTILDAFLYNIKIFKPLIDDNLNVKFNFHHLVYY